MLEKLVAELIQVKPFSITRFGNATDMYFWPYMIFDLWP